MSSSVASADGVFAGKHFLVIGGTQFMGRHAVSLLLARGARVTILNRGKTRNPFVNNPGVTHLRCDRFNEPERFRSLLCAGPTGLECHEKRSSETVSASFIILMTIQISHSPY